MASTVRPSWPVERYTSGVAKDKPFRPGRTWLDAKGERVQAHGGPILHEDGVCY
ncbi:hypothetical protein ABT300_31965 [Streptomyces sp. NPDC001027]|uniref:hypothetical protein n=1 Tax=Streptomyces sp. NPDC001027 TaxID=3154771 RepID=UPI00332F11F9